MADIEIPPAPYAPPGSVAEWIDGEWKIVKLVGKPIPPMPTVPAGYTAYWDSVAQQWVVVPVPAPPPPPTPEQITGTTLNQAGGYLSLAAWLSAPGVRERISPDSVSALEEWEAAIVDILIKAQKILIDGTGEAYDPEWPPYPSLLPTIKDGLSFTVYFNDPPTKVERKPKSR